MQWGTNIPLVKKIPQKRSFFKTQAELEFITKLLFRRQNEWQGVYTCSSISPTTGFYDTSKLIAARLETVGKENRKLAEYLKSVKDYRGAAGSYSATGDNRFELPATVKVVEEDGFKKL